MVYAKQLKYETKKPVQLIHSFFEQVFVLRRVLDGRYGEFAILHAFRADQLIA